MGQCLIFDYLDYIDEEIMNIRYAYDYKNDGALDEIIERDKVFIDK